MTSPGSVRSAVSAAAAGSWCSCEESSPATMTLASRAVTGRPCLLSTLADLTENLINRRRREGRPLLRGHRDPERPSLNDLDLAWQWLDFDLPFLDRDPQGHPGKDSSLLADRLGEDEPAGRVDRRLNGISHGI